MAIMISLSSLKRKRKKSVKVNINGVIDIIKLIKTKKEKIEIDTQKYTIKKKYPVQYS